MRRLNIVVLITLIASTIQISFGQANAELDAKVRAFLDSQRSNWRDWNVSFEDGQILYDLIVKNGYKSALEIGTSTGHSSVWIAWALSKTGGKLITLEIDADRRAKAIQNFQEAGLADYIDARLGDAHQLVKKLEGPFDFVFSDADKAWYKQYFVDLYPKLAPGACFTAHNVRNAYGGIKDFLDYVEAQPDMQTTIDKTSRSGISISYKKK